MHLTLRHERADLGWSFVAWQRASRRHVTWRLPAMLAGLLLTVVACERTPLDIGGERAVGTAMPRRADAAPPVAVTTLLDSLTVGGVYTVLPVSGFSGLSYPRPSERLLYANPIRNYPTGIALPVGLPVRVLAEGGVTSRPTAAFASAYCALYGAMDTICAASSYTYTVHGIARLGSTSRTRTSSRPG